MWVQYFYTAHFWALFCYALEAAQLLRRPAGHRSLTPYYLLCCSLPSTQCLWGVQQLLSPASARCDSQHPLAQALAVAHYTAAYVPLSLVLPVNPLLLSRALCAAAALLRRQMGRYTASEWLPEQQLSGRSTSITAILNPVSGLLLSLALVGSQRAGQPAGRALSRDGQSSSEDSPEPVVGLVAAPGQLRAPNLLHLLVSRASLVNLSVAETCALHPDDWRERQGEAEGTCPRG
ncbi:unnamed protein product [Natator depressus]